MAQKSDLPLVKQMLEKISSIHPTFRHGPRLSPLLIGKECGVKAIPEGMSAEHLRLGDDIQLKVPGKGSDGHIRAGDLKLRLENGLELTYGQINALAGDYYGTDTPISNGKNLTEQLELFHAAYLTLAGKSSYQPWDAKALLAILQVEIDAVVDALNKCEDPSVAYSQLPSTMMTAALEAITFWRPSGTPGFLGLSWNNMDHFGEDAHTAYNAGHYYAMNYAAKRQGDENALKTAYAMNAFADHFLEDSFSAGHTRTPRRYLHSLNVGYDLCAEAMHDEDNAIGLDVENKKGQTWHMYGDMRILDCEDKDNKTYCHDAVQASANEVYDAWKHGTVPSQPYAAWNHACTLESARGEQKLAPLFRPEDGSQRRANIEDRRDRETTRCWTADDTAEDCRNSPWWKYPITINGPSSKE